MNSLVYVEQSLIVPIAAKLIGSSTSTAEAATGSVGFNLWMAAQLGHSDEASRETRVADLFPEDVFYLAYPEIANKEMTVRDYCAAVSSGSIGLADVTSLVGVLEFQDFEVQEYDPFNPPEITVERTVRIYGLECFAAALTADGFSLPIYFLRHSAPLVCYMHRKPVEVVGVVKWSPSYDVAGYAINSLVLGAVVLLRR